MKELTENIIKDHFLKTGVDEKYFSYFEAELKIRHKAFQEEYPYDENEDEEERAEEEKMEKAYIECANEYIKYYVKEREKGHSHNWANYYALGCVSGFDEYELIHDVLNKLEDKEEKDKELTIHAKSINKEPLFVERFKNMVEWGNPDISEKTKEYCCSYHKCIKEGKSDIYAHAYAEAINSDYREECCVIYARAYELAKNHRMSDGEAYGFGEACTNAYGRGLYFEINRFKEDFQEKWQREFYLQLIEVEHKMELSEDDMISLKKRLEIPIMGEREIKNLIEELRHKSGQERRYGAEKCSYYDSVADYIEGNINSYKDDIFETEEDIIDDVKEVFDESDRFWDDIDEDELDNYEIH